MKKDFKRDFPFFSVQAHHDYRYFDNAATTQKPREVIDSLVNFYVQHNALVHRGIYQLAEEATELYESARRTVGEFIQADSQEIIFTQGTTESINFIAQAWARKQLAAGDIILVSELEHHSNLLPWLVLAREKNLIVKHIPITAHGLLDYAAFSQLLTDKVKLVAITAVSNAIGTHVDLNRIITQSHQYNAAVLVDAAQWVPHEQIRIQELKADFLAFSGHKLLAPTGIGVLYIAQRRFSEIEPYQVGGGMVYQIADYQPTWRKPPHKFEAGTPPIAQAIGLAAAIN